MRTFTPIVEGGPEKGLAMAEPIRQQRPSQGLSSDGSKISSRLRYLKRREDHKTTTLDQETEAAIVATVQENILHLLIDSMKH